MVSKERTGIVPVRPHDSAEFDENTSHFDNGYFALHAPPLNDGRQKSGALFELGKLPYLVSRYGPITTVDDRLGLRWTLEWNLHFEELLLSLMQGVTSCKISKLRFQRCGPIKALI